MRHYNSNSTMQTLELMWLNDQIRDMRMGRPPRKGPSWDIGPRCLLKFMALAVLIVCMVYRLGHEKAGNKALKESVPEQPRVEAPTTPARSAVKEDPNCEQKQEPMRLWTDASSKHQVEAILVNSSDDLVWLRKANGHIVRVAKDQLCQADREYVRTCGPPGPLP